MSDANPPVGADYEFVQPAPSDPIEAHGNAIDDLQAALAASETRVSGLTAMVRRILLHLDPTGNSRTLFPVDRDGEKL